MKKLVLILSVLIMFSSCGIFKKPAKENDNADKSAVKTEKTISEKEKKKQKDKEFEKRRKEKAKEQKIANKEFEKKKKQEEKEKKRKEKEQDRLIKNSAKSERQRIKEERRKEKESLLSSQKLAEQEAKEKAKIEKELEKQEENRIKEEQRQEELLAKQEKKTAEDSIRDEQEQKKEELRKKIEQIETEKKKKEEEERKYFESLSTMDQIVYRMQHPEQAEEKEDKEEITENKKEFDINNYTDEDVIALSDKEKKRILASKDKKEGNFITRAYKKAFPKKVPRSEAYPKIYIEQPKSLLVLYPWNRSEYRQASEMAYTSCVKELSQKGYYLPSALVFMDEIKKDTLLSTQFVNIDKIKECKTLYNVDAVMLLTIYRVEKPWWSTNINVVAHYDLISTSTGDTLFTRHADFNYDSPMPLKTKNNDKLITEPEVSLYLGLFEQMQKYVLLDMPVGPYHENYGKDKNKRSQPKENKYKVNIKPS